MCDTQHPFDPSANIAADLEEMRALLRQIIGETRNENYGAETKLGYVTASTRLFAATSRANETLARLNGIGTESRHRLIVDRAEIKSENNRDWPTPAQREQNKRDILAIYGDPIGALRALDAKEEREAAREKAKTTPCEPRIRVL